MNKLLEILASIIFLPIFAILIIATPFNLLLLLFGCENPSPFCRDLKYNRLTRIEYVLYGWFPNYYCSENRGLLNPYARNFFNYITEVPGNKND